jgi:hypothetical protein
VLQTAAIAPNLYAQFAFLQNTWSRLRSRSHSMREIDALPVVQGGFTGGIDNANAI